MCQESWFICQATYEHDMAFSLISKRVCGFHFRSEYHSLRICFKLINLVDGGARSEEHTSELQSLV